MEPSDRERLDALSDALARLVRQQREILARLDRLEQGSRVPHQVPAPEPRAEAAPPAAPSGEVLTPARQPEWRPRQLETRLGLTWINRVGAITLVLGIAFFFKYAVERHWIGETGRVLLGAAAGVALLALADRIWHSGQRIYAQGISGAGIAILYVSFYAAFGLYHLIAQPAAFGLMALTTLAAGALALRYQAMAMAALGLFGGYATPLLLSTGEDRPWFLFTYVLLLDAGAVWVARGRRWRSLEILAFAGTVVLYAARFHTPVPAGQRPVDTLFAIIYYAVFAGLEFEPVGIAAQGLAGLVLAWIWAPAVFAYLALAGGLLACGLALAARRGRLGRALAGFAAFWLGYAIWLPQSARPPGPTWIWITLAALAVLGWLAWRGQRAPLRLPELLLLALNAAIYFSASYGLLEPAYHGWLGEFAVAVALAHMAVARLLWGRDARAAALAAGAAWVSLVLAAPLQFSGFRITMAWSLEGAALAWLSTRLPERRAAHAALVMFAVVALRLLAFDSSMYPSPAAYSVLMNLRFLTFAVSAACLWGAAFWLANQRAALASYLGGHFALLWGLGLEVLGWAARVAAPEELRSLESTGVSLMMAAYALVLVAIGVATRSPVNRILGLALIGLIVAKLYLYDVWLLSQFYRMAAFAVLGALLLVMSYLYSRFRVSIESWWRDQRQQ